MTPQCNVGEISGFKSERTVFKFRKRKRKRKLLCFVYLLHKQAREIRKFHVAVVQRRLRNVQKKLHACANLLLC